MNYYDILLAKKLEDDRDPRVEGLSVTENGRYEEDGVVYKPVIVSVAPPEDSYQLKSITTPTPLATFEASAMPMPSLKVSVEAKQDLHGYDKPWVGGAGKNKCPMTVDGIKALNTIGTWSGNSYTQTGVTFTIQTDADRNVVGIKANGNATADIVFMCGNYILKAGSSIKYSGSVNGSVNTFWVAYHGYPKAPDGDGTADRTSASTDWDGNLEIGISNGASLSNQMFYPMIRLATVTDSTFAPYSNICPISGWDAANISDVGKNLFDKDNADILTGKALNPQTGLTYNTSTWSVSNYIEIEPSTTYTLNSMPSGNNAFAFYDSDKAYISGDTGFGTKITPSNAKYIRFDYKTEYVDIMQLEKGSTATPYEPYNGVTTTISLGQTVYGGELDVVNGGENPITNGYVDLGNINYTKAEAGSYVIFYSAIGNKALNYNYICSQYKTVEKGRDQLEDGDIGTYNTGNGRNYICIRDDSKSSMTEAEFKTAMSGVQLVYELATPTTFTTSPTPIKSLNGTNNLSVDCGEVIEGEYFIAL